METVDLGKLDVAIKYVQRIAEGYNPVNNIVAEEDSVLNNPNVIRCMYFVKDVLEEVRRNNGMISAKKAKAKKEPFPYEILKEFQYQEDKVITNLFIQIHLPLEGKDIKKIPPQRVTKWLRSAEYLTEEFNKTMNKTTTVPTDKGKELGIYTEQRTSSIGNTYLVLMYNRNAQEFIVKNLEAIVNGEVVE